MSLYVTSVHDQGSEMREAIQHATCRLGMGENAVHFAFKGELNSFTLP